MSLVGTKVRNFRIVEKLGKGGMDIRFCYTATVHDDNGDHTTPDPELIVKKKKKS